MNNIVQLHPPKPGEQTFFMCGCSPKDPQPFIPIALYQRPPVICALICPVCNVRIEVINGVVQPSPEAV